MVDILEFLAKKVQDKVGGRPATKTRLLTQPEIALATTVFKQTIPYRGVFVANGLGFEDRPFVLPIAAKFSFIMNVGDCYANMDKEPFWVGNKRYVPRGLLIHELTHVWQSVHGDHSWDYVVSSVWNQCVQGDAYNYDSDNLKEWDEYGAEQQADIVEDWYKNGLKEDKDKDLRYYYIKRHILGQKTSYNWLNDQNHTIKTLDEGHLPEKLWGTQHTPVETQVIRLLKQRFTAADESGFRARLRKLEDIFRNLSAGEYLKRLQTRNAGDEMSELLWDRLGPAGRERLRKVLI